MGLFGWAWLLFISCLIIVGDFAFNIGNVIESYLAFWVLFAAAVVGVFLAIQVGAWGVIGEMSFILRPISWAARLVTYGLMLLSAGIGFFGGDLLYYLATTKPGTDPLDYFGGFGGTVTPWAHNLALKISEIVYRPIAHNGVPLLFDPPGMPNMSGAPYWHSFFLHMLALHVAYDLALLCLLPVSAVAFLISWGMAELFGLIDKGLDALHLPKWLRILDESAGRGLDIPSVRLAKRIPVWKRADLLAQAGGDAVVEGTTVSD
jgi:hypothetical protein